jgi:hypothetical protein
MGRFEYLVELQRLERRRARVEVRPREVPTEVIAAEWRPAPLGQLGRRLWNDIDRYLEFFALAREGEEVVSGHHERVPRVRAHGLYRA